MSKIFGMITTKHSGHYTDQALISFFRNTALTSADKFWLIDNDASYSLPLEFSERLSILTNPSPLGFAQNANQLVQLALKAKADLYLLNNDLIFTRGWLEPLELREPTILSPLSNREIQYSTDVFSTQVVMELKDYLGQERGLDLLIEAHKKQRQGYLKVLVVPFFCAKIPLSVLETLGNFDQQFGVGGGEDYDYCLRAYLTGFECKYALSSYLVHFGGKSSYAGAETKSEQALREEKFKSFFQKKWGEPLYELILRDNHGIVENVPSLKIEIDKGNHQAVIRELSKDRKIALRL